MIRTPAVPRVILRCLACLGALAACVAVNAWAIRLNATTAALYMLLVVLTAAARWGLAESIFTSVAGVAAFNFFFLPPVRTFTVADPANWAALAAFLITGVIASKLSANARRRTEEAQTREQEISRLYELSRALLMDERQDAIRQSVLRAAEILDIEQIAFCDIASGEVFGSAGAGQSIAGDLARVAETGMEIVAGGVVIMPVHMGTRIIGSLALPASGLGPKMRESVASLLAINLERSLALNRAAAAEAARRNEEFKSHLLDGLAHDLKTPLTAIRTCATRLIDIPPRSEEVRQELLTIIDQESRHLQATITETLELARIESSSLRVEKEDIDAQLLISSALEGVRDENRERYFVRAAPDMRVHADPNLLTRALIQILENARKYAPPESPILIEAQVTDGQSQFMILDKGTGFSPDEIGRVFDKFYRGRNARRRTEGTGMGLAIAKGIIEAHGGKIRAANRPGGGAAILLTLPAG